MRNPEDCRLAFYSGVCIACDTGNWVLVLCSLQRNQRERQDGW